MDNFVILSCYLTENRCYKVGKIIKPKGVMVHSTGANNPNLKRYVQPLSKDPDRAMLINRLGVNANKNDWNRSDLDVCVHAFVGKFADGSVGVVQTLPWNRRGWHAGTGSSGKSANDTHISFEICEDALTDHAYFLKAYDQAVKLTATLCMLYDLNPLTDGVVICHSEGANRGIASSHADVMHWFPKHGKTMNDFRRDVANLIEKETTVVTTPNTAPTYQAEPIRKYKTLSDVPEYFRPSIEKIMRKGALQGTGDGEINVSYDFCRTITVLDRLGKLD